MSTNGVDRTKQMLQDGKMNIGGRIVQRLNELGWERKNLFDAVPDLTPQALSNLIRRDSKRSEWDVAIAQALGVSVLWLVYGEAHDYKSAAAREIMVAEPAAIGGPVRACHQAGEVGRIMQALDAGRQEEVLIYARERLRLQQVPPPGNERLNHMKVRK